MTEPGAKIRAFRNGEDWNLDQMAERIRQTGCARPSTAKLSRIETGQQPVPLDILEALVTITGLTPGDLRPDIAAKFAKQPGRAA